MIYRVLPLFAVLLAFVAIASRPAWAVEDKPHEGQVVSAGDGKLTMTFKGHEKQHTHHVSKDAKITLDDKPSKLEDLKAGFHVKVVRGEKHVITKIDAHSKSK